MPNAIQSEYLRVASVLDRNGLHEQAEDLMARYAMKMATLTHGDYPGDPETLQRVAALEEFINVTADSQNEAPEFRVLASRLAKIRGVYEESLRTAAEEGGADNEVAMILDSSVGSIFRSLMTQAYETAWNHLHAELSQIQPDDPWYAQHQNLLAVDNGHVIFTQEAAQSGASYSTPLPDGSTGFGVMQQFLTTHGTPSAVRSALTAAVRADYISNETAAGLQNQISELPGLYSSVATWAPKLNKGIFKRLFSKPRFPAGKNAAQSANVSSDARILMDLALASEHTDTLDPARAEEMVSQFRVPAEEENSDAGGDVDPKQILPEGEDDDELDRMQQGLNNRDPWAALGHLGVGPEDIDAIRNAKGADAAEYYQHLSGIQHEVDEIEDPTVDKDAVRQDIQDVLAELQQKAGDTLQQASDVPEVGGGGGGGDDAPVPPVVPPATPQAPEQGGPANVLGLLNGDDDPAADPNEGAVGGDGGAGSKAQHTDWRSIDPTDISSSKVGHVKWNGRFNIARDGRSGLNTIIMTVPEIIPLLNEAQGDPERIKEIVHAAARIAHSRLVAHYAADQEKHVHRHGPVKPQANKVKEGAPSIEPFVDQAIADYSQDNGLQSGEINVRAKSDPMLMLTILKHAAVKHATKLHEDHQNWDGNTNYFENGDKFWRELRLARHIYGGSMDRLNPEDPLNTKIPGRRTGESINHMYPDSWGWSQVADAAADAAATDNAHYNPKDFTSGRQQRDWDTWRNANQAQYDVLEKNPHFHPSMLEGIDEHDHSGFGVPREESEPRGRRQQQQQNGLPVSQSIETPPQAPGIGVANPGDGDPLGGGAGDLGDDEDLGDGTVGPIKQSVVTEVAPNGQMISLTHQQLQEMLNQAALLAVQGVPVHERPAAAQGALRRILGRFKPKFWRMILPIALVTLTGMFGLQKARQITTDAGRAEIQQSLSRDQSPSGQYGAALEPSQVAPRRPAPQFEMKPNVPQQTAPRVAPVRPRQQESNEVSLDPETHQPTLMGPLGK